jgi:hypothetical protein
MSSISISFREEGFTYVNPRNGYLYKVLGVHEHQEIINQIKHGAIPVPFIKRNIGKGDHKCREFIMNRFKEDK